ncbi:hypothetical protein B296_00022319 [Ensete ventricosum]|uniref:Uncharacterized protein n=1 Tax=Ensete ventricosum TaxID=4639 RepID=A0A427AI65_ENSVE|nr:hypothetical protein B296_00022319 [Ensete ventricosum]
MIPPIASGPHTCQLADRYILPDTRPYRLKTSCYGPNIFVSESRFSLPSGKAPYRPVHTDPITDWYADHLLSSSTAKIDCRRSILDVDDRLREKSTVDDRLKKQKGKKKRKRRKKKKRRRSTSCRPRLRAAHGSPVSPRRPCHLPATFVPATLGERPRQRCRGDEEALSNAVEKDFSLDAMEVVEGTRARDNCRVMVDVGGALGAKGLMACGSRGALKVESLRARSDR